MITVVLIVEFLMLLPFARILGAGAARVPALSGESMPSGKRVYLRARVGVRV